MYPGFYLPSNELSNIVAHYLLAEEGKYLGQRNDEITLFPGGLMMIGLSFGAFPPIITYNSTTTIAPAACVIGCFTSPIYLRFFDNRQFGITFKPLGFYRLTGISSAVVTNSVNSLESLGIKGYEFVLEQLQSLSTAKDKVRVIEKWLLQIRVQETLPSSVMAEYILKKIIESGGLTPLEKLLSPVHINPRYAERSFKSFFGITPKGLAEIIRFNLLLNYMSGKGVHSLSDLAEVGNFYDNSHFIKHFEKYAGGNPAAISRKLNSASTFQKETLQRYNIINYFE